MKCPRRPTEDSPIDLQWAWDVVDAIRERTPLSFYGLMPTQGPSGFSLQAYARPVSAKKEKRAWEITLNGDEATFEYCFWSRGPKTGKSADLTATLTGGEKDCWVGVEVNTVSGVCTILSGAAWSDVVDTSVPAPGSKRIRKMLYHLTRPSSVFKWSVAARLTDQIEAVLYV